MKGFSGFKDSPVKAVDAGLIKAADNMSRGLEDPTSLIGEGVLGFLKGYAKAEKIKAKNNNAYDNLPPPPKTGGITEEMLAETKKRQEEFEKQNKPAPTFISSFFGYFLGFNLISVSSGEAGLFCF